MLAWVWAVGWVVVAAVGPFVGLLLGAIALGTIPAVPLGVYLGRNRARAILMVTVGAGIAVLPAAAAATGAWTAGEDASWLWALAAVGLVLYALPLVIGGCVGAWLAGRERR
ncbi:hypothetical protein AB0D08_11875 [Kitasatospora sp. NPDC048540]|uniref:hypothetical protein n=1 Tax=Kitasatospora sp. NPDC048540 TaxID=3155634 RepID=UPI0033EF25C1